MRSAALAAAAALVRPNGLVLAAALGAAALRSGRSWHRPLRVVLPAALCVAAWLAWLWWHTGDPLVFAHAKSAWHEVTLGSLIDGTDRLPKIDLAPLAFAVVVLGARVAPPAARNGSCIAALALLPSLGLGLLGMPRYTAACFPLFVAAGIVLARLPRPAQVAALAGSAAGLAVPRAAHPARGAHAVSGDGALAASAARFAGSRCVVTGGLGFIGSNLALALAAGGARVTVIDALIPSHGGNPHNLAGAAAPIEIVVADIADATRTAPLVRDADYVFNLAGQISHLDSMEDPLTDFDLNARAHLAFLETLRAQRSRAVVVYSSTRQLYGRPRYLPVDEEHPVQAVDVNGISQYAGEQFHLLYARVYGLRACSLRLTNVYGPRIRLSREPAGRGRGVPAPRARRADDRGVRRRRADPRLPLRRRRLRGAAARGAHPRRRRADVQRRPPRDPDPARDRRDPGAARGQRPRRAGAVAGGARGDRHRRLRERLLRRGARARLAPRTAFADGARATLAFFRAHREWYR